MSSEEGRTDGRDLETVYRNEGLDLWRALVLSTGDPEVASDSVAEAYAQALRRGDALDNPAAWVRHTAFRIAAGEMKRTRAIDQLPPDIASDVPERFFDLWRALASLTPHQRTAVVLADYAGYSHREIARTLGSTVAAVGVHVHRGRKQLRVLLEEADD